MQGKKQGNEKIRPRPGEDGIGWRRDVDASHANKPRGGGGSAHLPLRRNEDRRGEDDGEIAGGHGPHHLLRESDVVISDQARTSISPPRTRQGGK
jgi:hypothetical protein